MTLTHIHADARAAVAFMAAQPKYYTLSFVGLDRDGRVTTEYEFNANQPRISSKPAADLTGADKRLDEQGECDE